MRGGAAPPRERDSTILGGRGCIENKYGLFCTRVFETEFVLYITQGSEPDPLLEKRLKAGARIGKMKKSEQEFAKGRSWSQGQN